MRPIHAKFPGLDLRAPALDLCTLPTPVHRLDHVSRTTGADVWIKRDGETHAALGGSKLRALEFLLAEFTALRKPIVAYGPEASGWLLDLAYFGRGLDLELLTFPMPMTEASRHKQELLQAVAGRRLRRGRDFPEFVIRFLHSWIAVAGGRAELAPAGGSSAISTIGYVNAAFELADQVARGDCPAPEVVVAPLGSGGLVTGLALGFALANLPVELIGVSIAPWIVSNKGGVYRLLLQAAWVLNLAEPRMARLLVTHRFKGTYGLPTPAGDRAIPLYREDGIDLDPVYSAKTAAAVLEFARERKQRILFWHTYRKPLLPSVLQNDRISGEPGLEGAVRASGRPTG